MVQGHCKKFLLLVLVCFISIAVNDVQKAQWHSFSNRFSRNPKGHFLDQLQLAGTLAYWLLDRQILQTSYGPSGSFPATQWTAAMEIAGPHFLASFFSTGRLCVHVADALSATRSESKQGQRQGCFFKVLNSFLVYSLLAQEEVGLLAFVSPVFLIVLFYPFQQLTTFCQLIIICNELSLFKLLMWYLALD